MRKQGIINTILIFTVCYGVLFYNIGSFINFSVLRVSASDKGSAITESLSTSSAPAANSTETEDSTSSLSEDKPESEETVSMPSTSVPVSAEAIKGKIISKYISPYAAPLSYDKVYVKNSTNADVNIKNLLEAKLSFKIIKNSEPQVLILHTHATETFMESDSDYYTENFNSRTTDNSKNMVKIGAEVTKNLNNAGIKTLHATTQHDHPQYSGSYTRAANTICSYLEKYPSIKVVIDLHRDAISADNGDKTKLVTEINGKKAAQVMLVMGSGTGGVSNFPNWEENLKLALKLQKTFETKYPTLARPLSLMSKNYNESLTTGSMLIEVGTDVNSLDEALYSAQLISDCLITLFNDLG